MKHLSPVEILVYLHKRTTIALSTSKAYHFERLLQIEKPLESIRVKKQCIRWLSCKKTKVEVIIKS